MHVYFTEEGSVEAVNARMGKDISPRLTTVMARASSSACAFAKEVEAHPGRVGSLGSTS